MSVSRIEEYVARGEIDYVSLYMNMYAAYNAWYYEATGISNDYEALKKIKQRFDIWHDYFDGSAMQKMASWFELVVDYCLEFGATGPSSKDDYRGMIDFWYAIRCGAVHGAVMSSQRQDTMGIRLAYETLRLFMYEVLRRRQAVFSKSDEKRLYELRLLTHHGTRHIPEYQAEIEQLCRKFVS